MKHFFLIMAALLSLAACKRDDDPAPSILGTWKFTGYKSINGVDGSEFAPQTADNCQGQDTFVFNTDGTAGRITHYRYGGICNTGQTTNYTYSYNATTKELTLTENGGTPETHEVIKLDNNNFEYVYNIYDKNSDGTPDKEVYIYTRVN